MMATVMHGPLQCTKCFADCRVPEPANGFQLINDPGYWGASDPRILVLGQSKGMKARKVYARGEFAFDAVAFAGIRDRLANVLASIGIPLDKANVDRHFTAAEQDVAFASLLRCSLSDPVGRTSGSPLIAAMDDKDANKWVTNCMQTWLARLNPRLRVVFFLV